MDVYSIPSLELKLDPDNVSVVRAQLNQHIRYLSLNRHNREISHKLHSTISDQLGNWKIPLGNILRDIWFHWKVIDTPEITFLRRSDMIGNTSGETIKKTRKALKRGKGGVIFLIGAPLICHPGNLDSYGFLCIESIKIFLKHCPRTIMVLSGGTEYYNWSLFDDVPELRPLFSWHFSIMETFQSFPRNSPITTERKRHLRLSL